MSIDAWRFPADTSHVDVPLDYLGALLLAASLETLIFGLVDPGSVALGTLFLGAAATLAGAFIWREKHFSAPLLPIGLFGSRAFCGANVMTFLLYAALSAALYFLPFNLIQVQGYSATAAGAAFLPMTLLLGFGSALAGDLIRRFNPRIILTTGPIIAGVGFLLLALPGADAPFVTGFLPPILIIGLGMTRSVAPLTTVVLNSVSARQAGVASGINNTVARVAGVMAVAVLTGIAIGWFSGSLEDSLREAAVPEAVTQELLTNASRLADLKSPANLATPIARTVDAAIATSYVDAFRLVAVLCGLLAVASGLVAWFSLNQQEAQGGRH
jgi:hypothetical protein